MKAMILAAGLGSRLRPLTDSIPKALIPVNGKPLLQRVVEKLKAQGINELIVNVHHLGEQVVRFIRENQSFGLRIEISRESELLDTGGGIKQAAWFFDDGRPFLVHNVDIITDLDIPAMLTAHVQTGALATLAVRKRKTNRYFLFDKDRRLCGWEAVNTGEQKIVASRAKDLQRFSFMGVHILSPEIFSLFPEQKAFSIVPVYLDMASQGKPVYAFPANDCNWLDVGKPETLKQASKFI